MVLVTKIISIFFDIIWLLTIVIIELKLEPWILAIIIIAEFSHLSGSSAATAHTLLNASFYLTITWCHRSTLVFWLRFHCSFVCIFITEWQFKAFWDTENLIIRWWTWMPWWLWCSLPLWAQLLAQKYHRDAPYLWNASAHDGFSFE